MNKVLLSTCLILLTAAATATGAGNATKSTGDVATGKMKSTVCAGCHGPDGNSFNPQWPKLAGQHPQYLLKQLTDFKAGTERSNAVMLPFATNTPPNDLRDIVAYFASQKTTSGAPSGDEQLLAQGKRLYRGGNAETGIPACASCHGPSGKGNSLGGFPALSGQHAAYTAAQLNAFKNGDRKNDAKEMMRAIARRMTTDEIRVVSHYIAELH